MTKKEPIKALIVCINYSPELISTGLYTTGLAEYLASEGGAIDVVTALPYYPAWKTFDGWRRPWWKSRISENGVRITHCPIYVPNRPTGAKRILHYISFAISSFPIIISKSLRHRPRTILVVAPSLINAPGALFAARLVQAKAWLHVQDFEVEAAYATGLLSEKTVLGRLAARYESWALNRFDKVSSISSPMVEKLRNKGVGGDRVSEFRNWSNLDKICPLPSSLYMKEKLKIKTKYVALYSGNLANKQGLEILIEAAHHLSHRDDITIAICGDGPMRDRLQKMSSDLPMVRICPLQPIESLNELLGMADVHLLPQIAGAADLVLPSKLANMLASGRPVIATAERETALGKEIDGCGVLVPPGDAARLASEIEKLISEPRIREELGKKARMRAIERWDAKSILARAKEAFEKMHESKT